MTSIFERAGHINLAGRLSARSDAKGGAREFSIGQMLMLLMRGNGAPVRKAP